MANSFNSVKVNKPNSNTFDLSHDHKYSMQMGKLVPVLLQEVIPGDVFNIKTETLMRFAPLVSPVMHNIRVFTHYFFVPNRIVWPNWEKFISPDLTKENPPAWPHFTNYQASITDVGSLADYLGIPTISPIITSTFRPHISAIPFAAYQAVYNEYYRDQNLISEVDYQLADGAQSVSNTAVLTTIRTRAWQHDYFTAALPFAQKGPAVTLPLTNDAELPIFRDSTQGSDVTWSNSFPTGTYTGAQDKNITGSDSGLLYSDVNANASTINDLRVAFRLQEWFEKAARGGSRYVEQLLVHWGVKSSDARLNRPEFLGGTRNPVIISEVLQTSSSDETSPQASMAGHALSAGSGKRIRYYAEEHGYIIGIQSVMPSTAYQQGLPRHFSRQSWEDYAWPTFAHLGEQAIINKELFITNNEENEDVFGYIPRYSEYRYNPSRVSGDFKTSLAHWHMGRIFSSRPNLNSQFIEAETDDNGGIRNDIFAVEEVNQNLWCHSYHKIYARRKLPKYGTPTL